LPMTSISPLHPAQGQPCRSFSKVMKDSPPSDHLMASSPPTCWISTALTCPTLPHPAFWNNR